MKFSHTYLHNPVLVVFCLCQSNVVVEEDAVFGHLLLAQHLCEWPLLHQAHIRVEDLQRYGPICR